MIVIGVVVRGRFDMYGDVWEV